MEVKCIRVFLLSLCCKLINDREAKSRPRDIPAAKAMITKFLLDLSLYFLDYMEPAVARRRLRARMQLLDRLIKGLRQTVDNLQNKKTSSLAHILQHNLQMVQSESAFLGNLIKEL